MIAPLVILRDVSVQLRAEDGSPVQALERVDLDIRGGECIAVMGATGSGKSTLGHLLAGLVRPSNGTVVCAAGAASQPSAAMVLQRPETALLGGTVEQEVGFACALLGMDEHARFRGVRAALAAVGIDAEHAAEQPVFTLSGGEQRRVATAAVLATSPRLLVLDEPTAGLDAASRARLRTIVADTVRAGSAVVMITHDPGEAALLASRLVVLRSGRVVHDGRPEEILAQPRTAGQLGIGVPPAVELAHAVASRVGATPPLTVDEPQLLDFVRQVTGPSAGRAAVTREAAGPVDTTARAAHTGPGEPSPPRVRIGWLPDQLARARVRYDARARAIAFGLLLAGAFCADTFMAGMVAVIAATTAVVLARVSARSVAAMMRPLVLVALVLAGIQLLVGTDPQVQLWPGNEVSSDLAFTVHRVAQLVSVLLASLALTSGIDAVELADALRSLLSPLRLLRIPVAELALVLGIGLAFVPTMTRDVQAVQLALRARGLQGPLPLAQRMRMWCAQPAPLMVHALRRARHLADSLHARGYDPRGRRSVWRPTPLRPADALPVFGAALVLAGGIAW